MKFALLSLALISTSAFACFDRNERPIQNGYEALRIYEKDSQAFGDCLDKLEDAGVNLKKAQVSRRDRLDSEDGPVIYKIIVRGTDRAGKQVKLEIPYSLRNSRASHIRSQGFSCGELDYRVFRCGN